MQKTKRYQKAFSKGLQIWITPHWQHLHGFGLAVKEQTHQTHGMPKYFFFLFRMFASSLAKGRWTEWEPALLSAVLHADQAVNDCAGTEVASVPSSQEERKDGSSSHFCMSRSTSSMQPLRWRACSEHWGSQGHLHSGQNVWWILGSNHITQQDEKLAHRWVLQLLLPAQRNPALDEFSRAGGKGLPSLLETIPRCSPRHDRQQSCVSLLLANLPQD